LLTGMQCGVTVATQRLKFFRSLVAQVPVSRA
jgi:hypothetical protein